MTNRDMASQENTDLWLEQQLAEAHALLGDIPKESESSRDVEETRIQEPCVPNSPAEEPMDTKASGSAGKPPRQKDRTSTVLLCVIAVELIAIAGIAFFWVSVLT